MFQDFTLHSYEAEVWIVQKHTHITRGWVCPHICGSECGSKSVQGLVKKGRPGGPFLLVVPLHTLPTCSKAHRSQTIPFSFLLRRDFCFFLSIAITNNTNVINVWTKMLQKWHLRQKKVYHPTKKRILLKTQGFVVEPGNWNYVFNVCVYIWYLLINSQLDQWLLESHHHHRPQCVSEGGFFEVGFPWQPMMFSASFW